MAGSRDDIGQRGFRLLDIGDVLECAKQPVEPDGQDEQAFQNADHVGPPKIEGGSVA